MDRQKLAKVDKEIDAIKEDPIAYGRRRVNSIDACLKSMEDSGLTRAGNISICRSLRSLKWKWQSEPKRMARERISTLQYLHRRLSQR